MVQQHLHRLDLLLFGYPGIDGRPLHVTVVRGGPVAPTTLSLAPGGTASLAASYPNRGVYPRGCPSGPRIEITPPNAYGHLVPVQWNLEPAWGCPPGDR